MRSIVVGLALLVALTPSSASAGGALAVGDCGSDGATPYGIAVNYPSQAAAGRAALGYCADASCKVELTVTGACVAFALDHAQECGARGEGYGASSGEAQSFALQYCRKYGGKDCHVIATRCDSDYYVAPAPSVPSGGNWYQQQQEQQYWKKQNLCNNPQVYGRTSQYQQTCR